MAVGEEQIGRRDRRRQERRRRHLRAGGAVVFVIAVGLGAVLALSGGGEKKKTTQLQARRVVETTTTTVPQGVSAVATTKVPDLAVYEQPDQNAKKLATLKAATAYRAPTTLLVDSTRKPVPGQWVPVTVPLQKPNSMPGWVKLSDVALATTPYEIRVTLWNHTLELLKNGQVVLTAKVILGTPETPTPTGRFYVTDPVNCNKEVVPGYPVAQCDGAYGAFAIGTSGLSEKLDTFAGTIPQIALHGTSLPDSELGKNLSNGCVRMNNDVIIAIAKITPLHGTPVTITAR
jgi:lipoprotein-anchoring transpeptidase ErfK/SrfK